MIKAAPSEIIYYHTCSSTSVAVCVAGSYICGCFATQMSSKEVRSDDDYDPRADVYETPPSSPIADELVHDNAAVSFGKLL